MTASPSNHYKAYNRATHTVAKTRQVVMLYDGAIRFLQQAKEAMEQGNIETRYNKLARVSEIITGLQSCLDFDAGQHAAQTLYDFYAAMDTRILQLHRTNNAEDCSQIIAEIRDMREVWDRIDRGDGAAPTPPASEGEVDALQTIIVSA